jgi:hypothetical protein
MNYVATKRDLRRLNRVAIKNDAKAVTNGFLRQLRTDLRYLIQPVNFGERGWIRCCVYYANTPQPIENEMAFVLLDVRCKDLDKLETSSRDDSRGDSARLVAEMKGGKDATT